MKFFFASCAAIASAQGRPDRPEVRSRDRPQDATACDKENHVDDCEALCELHAGTHEDLGWCRGSDACNWQGVKCYNGRVSYLDLRKKSFDRIPDSFGRLSELLYLNFYKANVTTLPETFGQLTNLSFLNLYKANLIGRMPESFGKLRKLKLGYLNLYKNQLTMWDSEDLCNLYNNTDSVKENCESGAQGGSFGDGPSCFAGNPFQCPVANCEWSLANTCGMPSCAASHGASCISRTIEEHLV